LLVIIYNYELRNILTFIVIPQFISDIKETILSHSPILSSSVSEIFVLCSNTWLLNFYV